MYTLISILHVIISILLIAVILLQLGQMGGFGGIFGGGVDQIFSTSAGSMFLKKVTIVIAILFVLTTIGLTIFSARTGLESIIR